MKNIRECTCLTCGAIFNGGPRAYYCPTCRVERQKEAVKQYRQRKKLGNHRPLGSIDRCEKCGNEFTVSSGLQKFCPNCAPIHAIEYDRETSITFYHDNKDNINPKRNERRRIPARKCKWCGKEFIANSRRLYCCNRCKQNAENKKQREKYKAQKEGR